MALVPCKECKKEISTKAKACPHCGAKRHAPHYVLKGLMILIFIGVISSIVEDHKKPPAKPADYALGACREFIKKSLHDPSSVDFDRDYPLANELPNNIYEITLGYRAKNGFGAIRHTASTCKMKYDSQQWILMSLK